MDRKISKAARGELLEALRNRYRKASRKEKAQILDELESLAQCHRKHAIRPLVDPEPFLPVASPIRRRIYGDAVREATARTSRAILRRPIGHVCQSQPAKFRLSAVHRPVSFKLSLQLSLGCVVNWATPCGLFAALYDPCW